MKKIQALIISLLFLITNNIQASFLKPPNPYSFGPQGRSVSDLRDFAKPKNMVRILPNRPIAATDSGGNRVYYTPDGKMTLSIAKDGSMSFSLGGKSKSYNSDGEFSGMTETVRGSGGRQIVTDKENRVIGYKTLNADGKVSQTFDKDNNLTATYVYTGQGAKVDYVINEKTKGRTYYDKFEREMYSVDLNGYIQRTYLYADIEYTVDENDKTRSTLKVHETGKENTDKTGLLVSIRDYGHNVSDIEENGISKMNTIVYNETFFDQQGKTLLVKNSDGFTSKEYHYILDDKGHKVLSFVFDNLTRTKTYYDDYGNATKTVNEQNAVITKFFDGYTVNLRSDGKYAEVTRYDIDGTELYTVLKNIEYNSDGSIDKVMDEDDEVWQEYHYIKDSEGNSVIDYVINYSDSEYNGKTYTWYEDGKPLYVTDTAERPNDYTASNIVKEFSWTDNILACTFDRKTGTTKWYNKEKELVFESLNERIISKNIYHNGRLVGKWDAQKKETTIFVNERAWISVVSNYEPTAAMIVPLTTHYTEITNAIEDGVEDQVLDAFMAEHGWKDGKLIQE